MDDVRMVAWDWRHRSVQHHGQREGRVGLEAPFGPTSFPNMIHVIITGMKSYLHADNDANTKNK